MICPFCCSQYGTRQDCVGSRCVMSDEVGDCLIKQSFQLYVSGERTKRADEEERLRRETEAAMTYWKMYKNGTREPVQFEYNDKITLNEPKTVFYHACSPEDLGF